MTERKEFLAKMEALRDEFTLSEDRTVQAGVLTLAAFLAAEESALNIAALWSYSFECCRAKDRVLGRG